VIRAHALTKRFGDHLAVDGVTLEVARGEVFGLLGPNGAGKTTTVRMLAGLVAPTSGTASIDGHDVLVEGGAARARIGLLTETPGLYGRLSARENLGLYAELYGAADPDGQVRRYLELLGLWERRDDPAGGFSKGMRQKLAIARALVHEPPVLFLDEPTSGLDPESARVVREFIATLRAEGRTIVLCTHNLDEADRLCDRVGMLRRRLLRTDSPGALRRGLYGRTVVVRLAEAAPPGLDAAIAALPFVHRVEARPPARPGEAPALRVDVTDPDVDNPALVRALVAGGAAVRFVEEERHSLEKVYFDLLAEAGEAGEPPAPAAPAAEEPPP
jgi:ABC-2 type transport system ATP-binding protein